MVRVTILILLGSLPVFAGGDSLWSLFASGSLGYTNYVANDLNDVMTALERQSSEAAGLNHYDVDRFNGHPRRAAMIGVIWRRWQIGLEGEFWVENFGQKDIPFYMNRNQDPRFPSTRTIVCADLMSPGFVPVSGGTAGCIDAQEIFTIIPLTVQVSRRFEFWRDHLWLGLGAGSGILAGNAEVRVQTRFVGENARQNDSLTLKLYPGINTVHKVFAEAGMQPWKWLGFSLKGGYRWSGMKYVEIQEKNGDSFLFGLVLGNDTKLDKGNRAYLIRAVNNANNILVFRNSPSQQEQFEAELAGNHYDSVRGDFSGWMLEAKIDLYWY